MSRLYFIGNPEADWSTNNLSGFKTEIKDQNMVYFFWDKLDSFLHPVEASISANIQII